jgi:hypothetical protein
MMKSESLDPTPGSQLEDEFIKDLLERGALKKSTILGAAPYDPQLFDAEVSKAAKEEKASPSRFLGKDREVGHEIKRETYRHRVILYAALQGKSPKTIAEETGYSESHVRLVMRQPWFRQRLAEEMDKVGLEGVHELLRGAAADSVLTLISLRDDEKTSSGVKAKICFDLLDRTLGKAIQPHLARGVEDLESLDREIQSLQSRLAEKSGQRT